MGGCCSSSRPELRRTSIYTYCPEASEHGSLPTAHGTVSVLPTGLLVIQNLETTIPESFRAPPSPLPFSMGLNSSETLSQGLETSGNKSDPVMLSGYQPLGETLRESTFEGFKDLKVSDSLNKTCYPKADEDKSSILNIYDTSAMEEEDVCPTCLEEYDEENPRIIAKCQHHFHLSCIFEWMERSDTCPICDKLMVVDQAYFV